MSQFTEGRIKTYAAGEALEPYRLVKGSSDTVVYADSGDTPIGVNRNYTASGSEASVTVLSAQGTIKIEAAAAITQWATVYCKNDGKVDDADAGSDVKVGIALEAATAAGDIIEILPALQL